ncbi:MAG: metallophosphoesterase family protein [Acholeplasmataceae bacterium]|jgi:putative phosphoesterase|nr:metallophosphoesterase family protein [Acholeplasmataceae bacterium]
MKILITSDLHRATKMLDTVLSKHPDIDHHIDAGDSQLSVALLEQLKIVSVKGNTDFFIKLPEYRLLSYDGKKILLIHGHHQRVKSGLKQLISFAKSLKVDICIYGHTHRQNLTRVDNLILLNPGALMNGNYALYYKGEILLY